jgi:hypothetical protein
LYGRRHFQPVADDAGVSQQFGRFGLVVSGDENRVKLVERLPVALPLLENGQPVQASLRSLQDKRFSKRRRSS